MNPFPVIARWALVLVTALVLQTGLAPLLQIDGITPQLFVVLAACAGLSGGAQRGAVVGFWAGIVFDLARPVPLGLSALTFSVIAFAAGTLQVVVVQAGRLISMVLVAVASALGLLLDAVVGEFFGRHALTHPRLVAIVVVGALVGGALSRVGLRVAGWADGPDVRAVAE